MQTSNPTGEARARRVEELARALLQRVEGLDAEALYWAPSEDEWTVMRVLAHTAELLPYWARQAREVASRSQDNQPFGRTHEDPDRIAAVESHADDTLDQVLPRIRDGLAEAVAGLRSIPEEGWKRTGRHERRGEMTVEHLVDFFLVQHLEEHLQQAESVLARREGGSAIV